MRIILHGLFLIWKDNWVISMEDYVVCEFKKENDAVEVSVFDLNINDLVFEKMFLLFQKLMPLQKELSKVKAEEQNKRNDYLLKLDFATLTGEKRPTVAMKDSIMDKKLEKELSDINKLTEKVEFYKNKIKIVNDLISNARLLLKIENELIE